MTSTALRSLRRRLRFSQAGLARLLGIAPNSVARAERGEVGISEPVARLALFVARDIEEGRGYANYLATIRGKRQTRPSRRKEEKQ
jgi:transcriptional regulator with XRE-family HTH domain